GDADQLAPAIEEGRDCHRNIDRMATLGQAHRFERLNNLASLEMVDDVVFLLLAIRGDQTPNGLSNDLLFGVAKYALGTFIPAGDRPIKRLGDDRIIGRADDRGHSRTETLQLQIRAVAIVDRVAQ